MNAKFPFFSGGVVTYGLSVHILGPTPLDHTVNYVTPVSLKKCWFLPFENFAVIFSKKKASNQNINIALSITCSVLIFENLSKFLDMPSFSPMLSIFTRKHVKIWLFYKEAYPQKVLLFKVQQWRHLPTRCTSMIIIINHNNHNHKFI